MYYIQYRKHIAATAIQSKWRQKKAKTFSEKKIFAIYTIQAWWREMMMKMRVRFATRNKNTVKNIMNNNKSNKMFGKSAISNIKN